MSISLGAENTLGRLKSQGREGENLRRPLKESSPGTMECGYGIITCLWDERETGTRIYADCHRREKNQKQGNSFCIYSDHHLTEEKGTKNKATVSASTQTITEEKGNQKQSNTVSVYTSCHRGEKETKSAISISTQTVTEAEQAKPVAVAPVQKKKSKSKSVRIMTDEDVAGPSHPAEETEPEIITRSLSLGELRDLRREFTRQTNESILTWLLRIWDAAANDTILDGSEARQLGSLSRDVVIDQGIGRTQQTLSLWRRLLTSVRDRYLVKKTSRCTKENGAQWNKVPDA
ncbi:hypothetical protein DUI87_04712 [Hirundo rustica rustica]|uniref:Uncharacterized protein n=1 Tax=Hirundo rustica rustica TaxID=333673 RepID=A0A3M0L170_HIRRU|nr:hypothetical protein DUI87_04712 [Hirundo rustica rustica]